jgi:hypothetical protein
MASQKKVWFITGISRGFGKVNQQEYTFSMKNIFLIGTFLIITTATSAMAEQQVKPQQISIQQSETPGAATDKPIQKLGDVKKIFVATLGDGRGAEIIRQKIINQLTNSGHITVVDSADEADATFNGVARLHRYGLYDDLVTSGEAVVRLLGKNKQILWTDEDSRSKFPGYGSANKMSTKIADKLVLDLTKAIELNNNK